MLSLFQSVLQRLKDECLDFGYEFILEADACGWLFHILLSQPGIDMKQVHLDTRVNIKNQQVDLAVGSLYVAENQRLLVQPQAVMEVKLFPRIGFDQSQHSVHYKEILERDLPKLGQLDSSIEFRSALIIDGIRYMAGTYKGVNRRAHIVERRNQIAPGVHLFMFNLNNTNWEIQHVP